MSKIRLGGWRSQTGCSCTARPRGPARSARLRVRSRSRRRASAFRAGVQTPFLRGPLRLAESFAMLPDLRRKLPEARLPFERPAVLAATLGSAVTVRGRATVDQAQRRRAGARLGNAVARAGPPRTPRRRARRLPRSRARLDRHLRARREAREGARALRLTPDRAADHRLRGRQHPGRPSARPSARPGADRQLRSAPSAQRWRSSRG